MASGPGQQVAFDFATFRHHFAPDELHGGFEVVEPEVFGGIHVEHVPHHRGLRAQRDERVRQQGRVGRTQTVPGHQHRLRAVHLVENSQRRTDVSHALQSASIFVHATKTTPVSRIDFQYGDFCHVAGLSLQSEHATLKQTSVSVFLSN